MTTTDASRAAIDSLVAPTPFVGAIAVSYLRVSTKEQAEKGGNAEGFSIPAQREANQRKADQLGATIVQEFVDAGGNDTLIWPHRDGLIWPRLRHAGLVVTV